MAAATTINYMVLPASELGRTLLKKASSKSELDVGKEVPEESADSKKPKQGKKRAAEPKAKSKGSVKRKAT